MPTLLQKAISGGDSLEWQLYADVHEFIQQLDDFVGKASKAPFIAVGMHLCADGTLDAIAFSANDYTVVLNCPVPFPTAALRKKSQLQNEPLSRLLNGEHGRLAGFGMTRLAMHIKKAFGVHVKGFDISSSISSKSSSPGQLLRDFVDYNADSHSLDMLWDTSPADQDDNPKRFTSLVLRAWLSAKYAFPILLRPPS